MTKIKKLHKEYKELKDKIFGKDKFVVVKDTPETKRFDQLFQYFYPQFRTKDYVNPEEQS